MKKNEEETPMSGDYDFNIERWMEIYDSLDELKEPKRDEITSNSEPPSS